MAKGYENTLQNSDHQRRRGRNIESQRCQQCCEILSSAYNTATRVTSLWQHTQDLHTDTQTCGCIHAYTVMRSLTQTCTQTHMHTHIQRVRS